MAKKKAKRKRRVEFELELKALAIDSAYEPVTKAGYDYRQEHVYPYLEAKGFGILRCQGKLARRTYVAPEAVREDVTYVTGVGHGSQTTYTGDHGDYIFSVGEYQPEEADGKVVHFLSCQTAAQLGPDFVENGCRAYFGYDVNFTFFMDYADVFFECDSLIDRAFADGLTAEEVYDRVIDLYDARIAELEEAGHDYVAAALETDRDHLCSPSVDARWGDPAATIV
jgi:hypothetical protein